jgi:pyrroline-5-carboxylate reductase
VHVLLDKRIGFLGCGNMGKALLKGWLQKKMIHATNVIISAKTSASQTAHDLGVSYGSPTEVILASDILVLAIKPQQAATCLSTWFKNININQLKPKCYMISLLAGTSYEQLKEMLPAVLPVIRVMPNLATKIAQGVTLQHISFDHTPQQIQECTSLLSSVGHVETLSHEADFHVATAIAGSGPAYFAMMIEAIADAGVYAGLTRQTALRLACHTMQGSAALSLDMPPALLKDQVASPAGVSIYAIESLESRGLRGILMQAVQAAADRSQEMQS